MAGYQVAVQAIRQPQGAFQIDPFIDFDVAQNGALQGFGRDVHIELAAFESDGGQAGAVDGDAVSDAGSREVEIRCDGESAALAGGVDGCYGAQPFDDSCKHDDSV